MKSSSLCDINRIVILFVMSGNTFVTVATLSRVTDGVRCACAVCRPGHVVAVSVAGASTAANQPRGPARQLREAAGESLTLRYVD